MKYRVGRNTGSEEEMSNKIDYGPFMVRTHKPETLSKLDNPHVKPHAAPTGAEGSACPRFLHKDQCRLRPSMGLVFQHASRPKGFYEDTVRLPIADL